MSEYVSMFRIDGRPILPPLMTDAVKNEMRKYRQLACQLEKKYSNTAKFNKTLQEYSQSSDDSSVELPTTYRKTESSFRDITHNDSIVDTSISSTIEESIVQNSPVREKSPITGRTYSQNEDEDEIYAASAPDDCFEMLEHFRNKMSKSVPPPVKEDDNDPSHSPSQLIRSNSYTLLTPSPMLLKQLKLQGVTIPLKEPAKISPDAMKPVYHSEKSFAFKTPTKKLKSKVISKAIQKKPTNSMQKKSPYEISVAPKSRAHTSKTAVIKLTKHPVPKLHHAHKEEPDNAALKSAKEEIRVLEQLKEAQKKQLVELLARQKEEEKKLEEQFHKKHEMILKQLHESIMTTGNVAKHNAAVIEPVSQVLLQQYLDMAKQPTPPSKSVTGSPAPVTHVKLNRNLFPQQQTQHKVKIAPRSTRSEIDHRNSAATIINAFVRGYLVRRLFKTDHVQKIVQVIRDTLIFVLDLHEESQSNDDPSDIILKSRLLQQLSSACYSLHEVFFSKTLKDRLDIISKDRDLMKIRIKRLQKLSTTSNYDFKISKKDNKIEVYST